MPALFSNRKLENRPKFKFQKILKNPYKHSNLTLFSIYLDIQEEAFQINLNFNLTLFFSSFLSPWRNPTFHIFSLACGKLISIDGGGAIIINYTWKSIAETMWASKNANRT